nr:hypothetical protein [uncultured bacterium]
MKKIVSLVLALCIMMAAVPVLAEPAEEKSGSKLEIILSLISNLNKNFQGSDGELSLILSSLKGKLNDRIDSDGGKLGSFLSKLRDKLSGGESDQSSLGSLFGGDGSEEDGFGLSTLRSLFGGDDSDEGGFDLSIFGKLFGSDDETADGSEEDDDLDFEETYARLNEAAEQEFGDGIPGKKAAESPEEFYGHWVYSKFVFNGEEYDFYDGDEGIFIGENTYYTTVNGEKDPTYRNPETVEVRFEKNALKMKIGGVWSVFILTEAGELVQASSLQTYFVRAGE